MGVNATLRVGKFMPETFPENIIEQKNSRGTIAEKTLTDEDISRIIGERIDVKSLSSKMRTDLFKNNPDTVESLVRLVFKIKDNIKDYDTILSDDASGRLPSRLLEKIINQKRKENGQKLVHTLFVASGRHGDPNIESAVGKFIAAEKEALGKTLLVTEFIDSGKSIKNLIEILEKEGIDFDIAAVSMACDPNDYNQNWTQKIKYGSIGFAGARLYNKPEYAGVYKKGGIENPPHPNIYYKKGEKKTDMQNAREDIKILSEEILKILD